MAAVVGISLAVLAIGVVIDIVARVETPRDSTSKTQKIIVDLKKRR